jgi:hypothetical protein
MNRGKPALTEKNKEDVLALFYRVKLYPGEKIIDNMDITIAKKLNLKTKAVSDFISHNLELKIKGLNKKIYGDNNKI